MQTRAILKSVDFTNPNEPTATLQLIGLGIINTFFDGYAVSHAIDHSLLVPGADCVVDLADVNRPGDGHVISVARITTVKATTEQAGSAGVITDGSGNTVAAVAFPTAFASAPQVTVSGDDYSLDGGSVSVSAVTTTGFTLTVTGARPSFALQVAWSAAG